VITADDREFRQPRISFLAALTLGCLVAAALAVLFINFVQWWSDYKLLADHPAIVTLPNQQTIDQSLAINKRELDSYSVQADTLHKLVTFLVGFSSLYAIVLGFSSYWTAQHFLEDSRRNAERVQELRIELEERLPMFHDFGRSLERVAALLTRLLPNADVRENYYEGRSGQEKQQILYYERSIAFFEYLDFSFSVEKVAEIYRGLSKFYSGHFRLASRQLDARRKELPDWQIKEREERLLEIAERGRFYGQRAMDANPKNFAARNDLAFALQDVAQFQPDRQEVDKLLAEAESLYRESLSQEPDQQCAYYNLARFMKRKGKLGEAELLLSQALKKKRWQTDGSVDRRLDILYNRACYRSKNAAALEGKIAEASLDAKAQGALADLKAACVSISKAQRDFLRADLERGGDLEWLVGRLRAEVYSIEIVKEVMSAGDQN
jgi:tetratricopeptide (TPR) repeat protein